MNKNGHPIEIEGTSLMDICKHLNKKINTLPADTIHSLFLKGSNGDEINFQFGLNNIFVCSHDRKIVYCLNPITNEFCILFPDDNNNLILANDPVTRSSLARKHTLTDAEIRRAKQLHLANRIRTSIMNKNTKKNVIPNILKEKNAKTIINNYKAKKIVNKNNTAKKNHKTPQIIQKNIHTNIVNKNYTEKKKFPALETIYEYTQPKNNKPLTEKQHNKIRKEIIQKTEKNNNINTPKKKNLQANKARMLNENKTKHNTTRTRGVLGEMIYEGKKRTARINNYKAKKYQDNTINKMKIK